VRTGLALCALAAVAALAGCSGKHTNSPTVKQPPPIQTNTTQNSTVTTPANRSHTTTSTK
jgi:uncharacterized lipoprotein YajG